MNKKIKELFEKYREVILYIIFGALTTAVNYLIYLILRFFGVDIYITNFCAWVGAVLFAYFTNRGIVFRSQLTGFSERFKELLAFYSARIFSLVIETILMYVFIEILHWNEFIVKLAVQFVVIALNYIFSKFFVFKKKNKE